MIPARCIIADGLVFGMVIKTGSSTLYATTEKKRDTTNQYQSIVYHFTMTLSFIGPNISYSYYIKEKYFTLKKLLYDWLLST